jgi:antitoxin ParD1/3/4
LRICALFFWKSVLKEHEKREDRKAAELKDAIKDAIQAGIVSGPGVPAQEVFDRLEKKYAAMGKGSSA